MIPSYVKCPALFWLQIQRGSFPALEGPSSSTWPWWCTVGLCRLRLSPRNFSLYILHCCSVKYSGPTSALLQITSTFINQIRKQAWLCFALLVSKADLKYVSLLVFGVMLCRICTVGLDPWLFLLLIRIVPQTREDWGGHRSATLSGE